MQSWPTQDLIVRKHPGGTLFTKLSKLLFYTPAGFFAVMSVQAMHKIEEIADPSLPDIAAVHFEPGKAPVILYNPILCRQAGRALCEFYRYHEYGHIELRHYERNDLTAQEEESEADRWAAKHAPLPVVMAAYRFFSSGGGATPVHGNSQERAARLLARTGKLLMAQVP